jgi:hypothetical protein
MTALEAAPGAVLIGGRCNIYGAETGGPKRVLGGLFGPASARTEDMDLPDNVAQGEWSCPNLAQVRCRAVCKHGHTGQIMELCSWHDEVTYHGEMVAGTLRQVTKNIRQRGHYEEFLKRQAGSCPACLYPPPYAELAREVMAWQAELTNHWIAGPRAWLSPAAQSLRTRVDDAGKLMDLAVAQGIIHNCPLTLVAVS